MLTPIKKKIEEPALEQAADQLVQECVTIMPIQNVVGEETPKPRATLTQLHYAVKANLTNDRPTRLNFRSGFRHFTNTCAVWWRLVQKSSRPSQRLWYELCGKH